VKTICAWCNRHIRGRGKAISHGICRRCATDFRQPRFEFMELVPRLSAQPRVTRRGSLSLNAGFLPVQQDFLVALA